jgi:hypothetical protein
MYYRQVNLTPQLLQAIDTAKLPTFAKVLVDDKINDLIDSINKYEWYIEKISESSRLEEALGSIYQLKNDFVNQIIYEIRDKFEISSLGKIDFIRIFNESAYTALIAKKEYIYRIYLNHLDAIILAHTEM